MKGTAVFWKRDFSAILTTLQVIFKIGPYSWSVIGGPKQAEILVTGTELDLWELAEYARCPVQIFSDKGDAVWWGFVAEIKIDVGLWSVGVNIDSMANYIAVAYEDDADQGQPKKTAWTEDTVSTAEYGQRELLLTSSVNNAASAVAKRDMELAKSKYPLPIISGREKGPNGATLYCRGWFDTLAWKYATIVANLAYAYTNVGTLDYSFGDNNAEEVAQSFTFGGDCNLASIDIYVKKVGNPTDDLTVSLCEINDGITPGAELSSGTIAGTSLTTSYGWVSIPMSAYDFTDQQYFIKLSRSGGQDAANYYSLYLDNQIKYALGQFTVLIGVNWAAGPDADMAFKLFSNDVVQTSQQISTLVALYGQFIQGVSIENDSGLYTESVRDGNANAFFEITELLKMGTSNYRRLLCEVTIGRLLRIYEEPVITSKPNLILKDGSISDPFDTVLRKETCPVGFWMRMKDIIPPSVDTTKLADPAIQFVDEMEYIPDEDQIIPTPRGAIDPFSIGVPKDG